MAEQHRHQILGLLARLVDAETVYPTATDPKTVHAETCKSHGCLMERVERYALCPLAACGTKRVRTVFIHSHRKPRYTLHSRFHRADTRRGIWTKEARQMLPSRLILHYCAEAQQLTPFFLSALQASTAAFWSSKPPKRAR